MQELKNQIEAAWEDRALLKEASTQEAIRHIIEELDKGRAFLTKGGVFSDDFIDAYIHLKSEEEIKVRTFVHPLEYDLYYSV